MTALLIAISSMISAHIALAEESSRGTKPMAMPIGRFLAEIRPAGKTVDLNVSRDGNIIWEAKSTAHEAELGIILDAFPHKGCRSLLLSAHSGGGHCCFSEALLTDCGSTQILTTFSPGRSALEMEQTGAGWVVHVQDWSFTYYMLDQKRHLTFGTAQPITRVLRFDSNHGWRPDDPGEFSTLHRMLQRDLENITTDITEAERAARAIAASAHVLLAGGTDTAVRQTLARLLPSAWLADLDTILADVIRTVSTYNPAENKLFFD